MDVSFITELD